MLLSVGMPGTGRLFMSCRAAFRGAYERCGFNTPGQLTHILRHTFASHYMMGGGDILGLQRILGHATIAMTMRYAHMSPLAQSGHREILRRSSGYSVRLVGIKSA
jgi:integrase